jgi:hypothetical protein
MEAEERRKEEVREKYEKAMEKAQELGEEEEEKKDEEEVMEKVWEKVVVEVLRAGEKGGCGRPKRKVSEGRETDMEGAEIGTVYIVDRERMVSKIFYFFVFIVLIFVLLYVVCMMSRDKVGVRVPGTTWHDEVLKMRQGEAGVSLGEGEASKCRGEGDEKEGSNRCGEQG